MAMGDEPQVYDEGADAVEHDIPVEKTLYAVEALGVALAHCLDVAEYYQRHGLASEMRAFNMLSSNVSNLIQQVEWIQSLYIS